MYCRIGSAKTRGPAWESAQPLERGRGEVAEVAVAECGATGVVVPAGLQDPLVGLSLGEYGGITNKSGPRRTG